MFFNRKTPAEKTKAIAIKNNKRVMQEKIDRYARNGYFACKFFIKKDIFDSGELSFHIVPIMKEYYESLGYKTVQDYHSLIIKW